ncbi:unnamed protein product [Heligmosomoides polygyrus]|uniref:Uncharacterized protein n=1 Tax=Heligmosomoides polygyrus TaxID=6339 RepID=A0A183GEH6_HELPZ|nr:unnamed protein product [Heligmosomoides polygyrus]
MHAWRNNKTSAKRDVSDGSETKKLLSCLWTAMVSWGRLEGDGAADFSKNHVDLLTRDVCRRESRFKSSRQEEYAHLDTGTDAPEKPSPSWQLPARGNSAAVRDPDSRTLPFLLHSVPPQPLLENGLQSERQTRRCAVPLRYICFGPRTASYWFINIPDRRLY